MSIFPKKITKNENVIIHLRFENPDNKNEIIKYYLNVINPNNKIIYSKSESILLGIDKEKFIREIYHSIHIDDNFMPGKYKVEFYLTCRGVRVDSVTKNNDFFYVEEIKIKKEKEKIILINKSNEKTNCVLYKKDIKEDIELGELETKIINKDFEFIEYGNHKIYPITNEKYYIKNPSITIKNNSLYDVITGKKINIIDEDIVLFKKLPIIISSADYNEKLYKLGVIIDNDDNKK